MTFFDRKEEVLEVELTPYGRYLLSSGKLRPVYYSFFDDDIVYDSDYMGYTEEQNTTEGRIEETPRMHNQLKYRQDVFEKGIRHDDRKIQNYFDKEYSQNSVLGVAEYYSDYAPAWEVNVLKGEIASTATVHSSSGGKSGAGVGPNYMIPQINMVDPTYKKYAGNISGPGASCTADGEIRPQPLYEDEDLREIVEYDNGTFVEIRKDFILLEILENNTTFQKENFDIELFEVEEIIGGAENNVTEEGGTIDTIYAESLVPLKFAGPRRHHRTEYIDYFFNLDVDMEIDEKILCKYKGEDEYKGVYQQRTFDCDLDTSEVRSPYETSVNGAGTGVCEDEE